ncbi:MAG TPA: IS630 family transposase [Thermomicrobiales bacterium]|nr:IS630 family transposase [Thermomicrobiales bacterium]
MPDGGARGGAPLRVGLLGLGAIGRGVGRILREQGDADLALVAALVRDVAKPRPAGSPPVVATLATWLAQDPQRADPTYLATCWTVAMLLLAAGAQLRLALSPTTLRAALHRLDLRWRRLRLAMPRQTDPEQAAKQWRIVEAVLGAGPEAAVRYADESRVQTLPLVRAMWSWVGQQRRIPTPGANATRALFGALEIRAGRWTYLVRERMRTADFLAFLEHLLAAYPDHPIILIVDNSSNHTAGDVTDWLAAHPRLQRHFLPTHCSHRNPVERLWLRLKGGLAAHRLYGSIAILLATVERFFAAMTPEQALRWAAEEE